MNRFFLVGILVMFAAFAFAITGCTTNVYTNTSGNIPQQNTTGSTGTSVKQDIDISGYAFNPANVTILAGTTVVWTNTENVQHTVVSDTGSELNSGAIAPGQSYAHTFNSPGVYRYHCSIHPQMTGTVIVK